MRHNLGTNRAPQVVDSVRRTHFFGVVQRCGAVSVGEDVDVRWREDLQSSFKSGCDQIGGLVAGNEKSSVFDVVLDLGFGSKFGWWRVLLEDDEKRSKGVTTASLVGDKDRIQ